MIGGRQPLEGCNTGLHIAQTEPHSAKLVDDHASIEERITDKDVIVRLSRACQRLIERRHTLERIAEAAHAADAPQQPASLPHGGIGALQQRERRLEPIARGDEGVGALRPISGFDQPLGRAFVARLVEMMGHVIRVGIWTVQQGFRDLPMPRSALERDRLTIQRLVEQCVAETVTMTVSHLLNQMGGLTFLNRRRKNDVTSSTHLLPQRERHFCADDRPNL